MERYVLMNLFNWWQLEYTNVNHLLETKTTIVVKIYVNCRECLLDLNFFVIIIVFFAE